MKMTFIGATHEVTGSCTYIEACGKKFLVDFGMEQGEDIYENVQIPTAPGNIDFVLLTHAHIDHSGLLPFLYAGGFKGEIHATDATANLCSVMLRDSAHIQEFEAEWRSRKAERRGEPPYEPLYTMDDALGAIELFVPHRYETSVDICEGINVYFRDAGHLLGSSSIILTLTEDGVTKKIVFSGDIGNTDQPLIRDPQYIDEADYVVMESTYGNRVHDRPTDYVKALAQVLQETFDRGGSVIIPSFAVGRTQEMLYFIRRIKEDHLVTGHDFKVFVDSPLANEATAIYLQCGMNCLDDETREVMKDGENPIWFEGLHTLVTAEESKALNENTEPKVIIASGGMCEGGRIRHHLKHRLWDARNTVLFVGYQAVGTLGRIIHDGAKAVKILGETIEVHAETAVMDSISGHADREGLLGWIGGMQKKPALVFVNHGDDESCTGLAGEIRSRFGVEAAAPYSGSVFDLKKGEWIRLTDPVWRKKEGRRNENTSASREKRSQLYRTLIENAEALVEYAEGMKEHSNGEIRELTEKIRALMKG